jgi:hypothetical protein
MSRTFNFKQSQILLDVDPKTFARWLAKAKIDPKKQVNLADPREKFLTEEQILMLAKDHARDVHFPPEDQEAEAESPTTALTALHKRLATLEQEMVQRFDQLTGLLANLEERIVSAQSSQAVAQIARPSSPTPAPAPRSSPTRTKAKKTTKGKALPRGLIPMYVFRQLHGISDKAVEHAIETGKLSVVRGKWLYEHRHITMALDAQGRQQFYSLFYERQGFQRCKECPHTP